MYGAARKKERGVHRRSGKKNRNESLQQGVFRANTNFRICLSSSHPAVNLPQLPKQKAFRGGFGSCFSSAFLLQAGLSGEFVRRGTDIGGVSNLERLCAWHRQVGLLWTVVCELAGGVTAPHTWCFFDRRSVWWRNGVMFWSDGRDCDFCEKDKYVYFLKS